MITTVTRYYDRESRGDVEVHERSLFRFNRQHQRAILGDGVELRLNHTTIESIVVYSHGKLLGTVKYYPPDAGVEAVYRWVSGRAAT